MLELAGHMADEVMLTRGRSVAEEIERLVETAQTSLDAALYRLNNPYLARVLAQAAERGVRLRLVLDRGKYEETTATREILTEARLAFRLSYGRLGRGSKMHHKFAILDDATVLTGSYNWTIESEKENFDNLVVLREPAQVELYRSEFENLWNNAEENPKAEIKK
jgi:mitochondrial cardiolipin hydrolase